MGKNKPTLIVIPDERPPSWNTFYSGTHWRERNELAKHKHLLVRAHVDIDQPPYDVPVDIVVTAYFDKRPYDADNIIGKVYVDGLKKILLAEDTPQFVASVTTRSRIDRENPRLEIYISPVEGD